MIKTDAWVLPAGPRDRPVPGKLSLERIALPEPSESEVLIEPLIGCWEANMSHAVARSPIDICHLRGETSVVLGNSGVVRVLRPGSAASGLVEGDLCLVMPFGVRDDQGYVEQAYAYDTPGTNGLLARQTVVPADILLRLPAGTPHSLKRWAAAVRYFTAWDNWKVAYGCWRTQMPSGVQRPFAFGWGGGVALGELILAQRDGFATAMTSARPDRLAQIKEHGIIPVDRRDFPDLEYDQDRAGTDPAYRTRNRAAEADFLEMVKELSGGRGVDVFIDNIGGPLYKVTLKSLARQGVLATVGWKAGMRMWHLRATECIQRHIHVNTHVWRYDDCPEIRNFQESTGWLPPVENDPVYDFDEIPRLAEDFEKNRVLPYFPLFQVNPL